MFWFTLDYSDFKVFLLHFIHRRDSTPSERQEPSQGHAAPDLLYPPSEWLAWGQITLSDVRKIGKPLITVLLSSEATLDPLTWACHLGLWTTAMFPGGFLCYSAFPWGWLCSRSWQGHLEARSRARVLRVRQGSLTRPNQRLRICLSDLTDQQSDDSWRFFSKWPRKEKKRS